MSSSAPQVNFELSTDLDKVQGLFDGNVFCEDAMDCHVAWPKSMTRARTFGLPVFGHKPYARRRELSVNSTNRCLRMSSTIFSTSVLSKAAKILPSAASPKKDRAFKTTFSNTSEILELTHLASRFQKNRSPLVMPSPRRKFFTSKEQ